MGLKVVEWSDVGQSCRMRWYWIGCHMLEHVSTDQE